VEPKLLLPASLIPSAKARPRPSLLEKRGPRQRKDRGDIKKMPADSWGEIRLRLLPGAELGMGGGPRFE